MSRIALHPIEIPEDTEVAVEGDTIRVEGPNGELEQKFKPSYINISLTDDGVELEPAQNNRQAKALWGTYASLIRNMITGVNEGYDKKLTFKGIGYQATVKGDTLEMDLGYANPVTFDIPENIDVEVEGNEITVSGIDKEEVGQFAARIRSAREPEPYKGTGIQYKDETIRRKEGKKTV